MARGRPPALAAEDVLEDALLSQNLGSNALLLPARGPKRPRASPSPAPLSRVAKRRAKSDARKLVSLDVVPAARAAAVSWAACVSPADASAARARVMGGSS